MLFTGAATISNGAIEVNSICDDQNVFVYNDYAVVSFDISGENSSYGFKPSGGPVLLHTVTFSDLPVRFDQRGWINNRVQLYL